MARKVTSMKVIAAVTAYVEGVPLNVTRLCRDAGVSSKTFYKWAARYRAEGLVGLGERSRRPLSSPSRTPQAVVDAVVALRGELATAGLDHGAATVHWHLARLGGRVPSVSTVHRILVRAGLVTPQPQKRPRDSWKRFEAAAPNESWQIDATEWRLAGGRTVWVFNIVDDHSRVVVASRAVASASGAEAWAVFCRAGLEWGLPAGVLSDNGMCFSGRLRGIEVAFEASLREAGIRPITGRPFHPQTTGKVERFQQTLKKWLRNQKRARSIAQLQAQLDRFCRIYNYERPHQGIGRTVPFERWQASPAATPAAAPLEHPAYAKPIAREVFVERGGKVSLDRHDIQLESRHAGQTATVIADGTYATIFVNGEIVRHLKIDPTRRYQASGKPRGPKPRLAS